jgi:hypothetical protein
LHEPGILSKAWSTHSIENAIGRSLVPLSSLRQIRAELVLSQSTELGRASPLRHAPRFTPAEQ